MANRATTLVKKARELEVLCDVPVCLLCFTPDGELYSWPDNEQKLRSVLKHYQQAVSSPATKPSKKRKLVHSDDPFSTATGYCPDLTNNNGDELLRCIGSRLEQLNHRINELQSIQQESQVGFEWELEREASQMGFEWLLAESSELDLELGGFWYDMDENNNIILY